MTEMLDPFEIHVVDSEEDPNQMEFDLGPSCYLGNEECEACQ